MTTRAQKVKYALAAPAFIFAVVAAQLSSVIPASAAAVSWDGDAGDGKFSTAANWSNDAVPTDGDNLIFVGDSIGNSSVEVNNDLTGLSVSGISFSGTADGYGGLSIAGNALTVTGNISNTATYSGYPSSFSIKAPITLGANITAANTEFTAVNTSTHTLGLSAQDSCTLSTGLLSGSGTVNIAAGNTGYATPVSGVSSFSGSINVNSGRFYVLGNQTLGQNATVTATGSGSVGLIATEDKTYNFALSLGGTGTLFANQNWTGCSGGASTTRTTTLTGPVILTSDFKFSGENNLKLTGTYTTNGFTLSVVNGSAGTLTTPQGTTEPAAFTTQLDGDKPSEYVGVANKETAILNGTRNGITVNAGGTLKGTGTAESIYNMGTVNPGNSPGTIHVTNSYSDLGLYQVELQNKDSYDKIVVGPTGTVNVSDAQLAVVLYDDWKITAGDTFTIIDNQGSQPITGTYEGLAEGAQLSVGGATFSISYVGGDGNDLVLTAVNTVSAPNTGVLQIVKGNPLVVLALGLVSVIAIAAISFRRKSTR